MNLELRYGRATRSVRLPAGVVVEPLDPPAPDPLDDLDAALGRALREPVGGEPLADRIGPRSRVLLVVADPTRGGNAEMLPAMARMLAQMGVGASRLSVLVARGTHRALRDDERRLLRSRDLAGAKVLEHDCDDAGRLSALVLTSRGTPVRIHRALREHDVVVLLGPVTFHYFAGYGGGRKLVLPGCADRGAILANHRLALVDGDPVRLHPNCRSGNLEGNPVHEDMLEAASALDPLFAVNAFTDSEGRVAWVNAGDVAASHREACEAYGRTHRVRSPGAAVVVASCGGWPADMNLLQAHKALRHACAAAAPGGAVLLLAECAEGVGSRSLERALTMPHDRFLRRARRDYDLNNQTAVSLLGLTARNRVGMVSALDAEWLRAAGIEPVDNPEAFIATALEAHGADSIAVVRDAPRTLPVDTGGPDS